MKTTHLLPLLLAALASTVTAQQLPVPSTLKPTTLPSSTGVDKLADDAQKAIFNAADKGVPSTTLPSTLPSNTSAPKTIVQTTGPTRGSFPLAPTPGRINPATWARDSVHQLAIMEIVLGGSLDTVIIELFPDSAPQTVTNFIDRCESRGYDGLAFHRAIENFLVQTGDPLTADEEKRDEWGTGGEDKSIPAEIKRTHTLGSVAMARRSDSVNPSRKSNGSQFYISLGNYGAVDGKYTVFGQVVDGIESIQRISRLPADSNDCPIARIEIKTIRIVEHKGPLIAKSGPGSKQRYRSPGSNKGFVERFLERVW